MDDEQDPRKKRYYHGGDGGLKVGDYILPPNDTGKDNMIGLNPLRRKDRVYITKDIAGAMFFASRSENPIVYEVTPEGDIEDDPDHKTKGISFACPKAKVIALYTVPEEVIQRNRWQMMAARLK
jgi:rifampin ADP-ribosylating transferase